MRCECDALYRAMVIMKGTVAYDSVFGNTGQVASAIAEELEKAGHEVALVNLRASRDVPAAGDFLFVGSPTRVAKMTGKSKRFVKKLDVKVWGARPVAIFDTHMAYPEDPKERAKSLKWIEPGAAGRLSALATERGLSVRGPPLRCVVKDMKGPLAEGQLEKAREYARQFAASLGT